MREWTPPQGQARAELLEELRETAGDRPDLLAQAAGVLLGGRPPDQGDPRWTQRTFAAELLLELAGLTVDDPQVQRWIPIGAERRAHGLRPEPPRR